MSDDNLCMKCRRPKETLASGSLTQWILLCQCDVVSQQDARPAIAYCTNCLKRIDETRTGSLTQWIFSDHRCQCAVPSPALVSAEEFLLKQEPKPETTIDEEPEDEDEIELDPDTFPSKRYKPLALLGEGALGQVHLCRDRQLKKLVAVKCLRALTDERAVMFQNEARFASKINHESVIKVLDFGTTSGGRPFMVMEYFDSRSLQEVLSMEGKLAEKRALDLFVLIADALRSMHEAGIYHRDLKPSNILISKTPADGSPVRLIDFGISQSTQEVQSTTMVQGRTVSGTPGYMSPDQVSGLPYEPSSEIYSLGCVMYETLTGTQPFKADTALEVLNKHLHEPTVPLSVIDEQISETTCRIVEKCLEKEQKNRYQNVVELKQELQIARSMLVETAGNAREQQQFQSQQRNANPLWLTVCVLAVIVTLAGIGIASYTSLKNAVEPKKSPEIKLTPTSFERTNPTELPDRVSEVIEEQIDNNQKSIKLDFNCSDDNLKVLEGSSVETLNLELSQVTDGAFQHLQKMPALRVLIMDDTAVKTLDGVEKLNNVITLGIRRTKVNDDSLARLAKMPHLRYLYINGIKLSPRGFSTLGSMKNLVRIDLDETQISDSDLQKLGSLKNLQFLGLAQTPVSAESLRKLLPKLTSLRRLDIKGCQKISLLDRRSLIDRFPSIEVTGDSLSMRYTWRDDDVAKVTKATYENMVNVDFMACGGITDKSFQYLNKWPLRIIDMTSTSVRTLENIEPLAKTLITLSLKSTEINDQSVERLKGFNKLETLCIASTKCTNRALETIATLPELKSLDLRLTRIDDNGLARIARLKRLEDINLTGTEVTLEPLTKFISNSQSLKSVQINGCKNITAQERVALRRMFPSICFPPQKSILQEISESASALGTKRDYAASVQRYQSCLQMVERHYGHDSRHAIPCYGYICATALKMGQVDLVESSSKKLVQLGRKFESPAHVERGLESLQWVAAKRGDRKKAAAYGIEAMKFLEQTRGAKSKEVEALCIRMASHYNSEKQFDKALEVLRRSVSIRKHLYGASDKRVGYAIALEGEALRNLGRDQEALSRYEAALEILEPVNDQVSSDISYALIAYRGACNVELRMQHPEKAMVYCDKGWALNLRTRRKNAAIYPVRINLLKMLNRADEIPVTVDEYKRLQSE